MIEYTIICPNCKTAKIFKKKFPSSREKKFCSRNCATSYLNKKTWTDPEVRKNRTEGITKQHHTKEYRQNAQASWTEERRAGASQRAKDTLDQKIHKPGAVEKMRKTKRDKEHRELARQQAFERWANPEFKTKRLEQIQEMIQSPEYHEAQRKASLLSWENNEKRRQLISHIMTELWNDPEWAKQTRQNMMVGWRARPTRPELALHEILISNDYLYEYTGDGSFWIGPKNPDFIWLEQNRIIELFGSYWHKKSEVELRTKIFAEYGYDSLIIWDYELDNEETLLTKLKEFHQGCQPTIY